MRQRGDIRALAASRLSPEELKDTDRTAIETPDEIEEILKFARMTGTPWALRWDQEGIAGELMEPAESGEVRFSLQGKSLPSPGQSILASFQLFREFHLFQTKITAEGKGEVTCSRPSTIYRVHRRKLDRSLLAPDTNIPIRLREQNGRRTLQGKILDLSPQGFGLTVQAVAPDQLERFKSTERNVIVETSVGKDQTQAAIPAAIVHWRELDPKTLFIGVGCAVPLAQGDQHAVEDFLLDQKYPNVRRARSDPDYREVWKLINMAFQTLTPADQTKTETSIVTWKKASWSPTPINRIYLLKEPGDDGQERPTGTIAVSRFYSKTWLIHQLGVDRTKAQVLTYQLYGRVADYLRQTQEAKFFTGCWPRDSRVFQRYYVEFIQGDAPGAHYLEETNILEFDVEHGRQGAAAIPKRPDILVEPLHTRNNPLIMQELRKSYPDLVLEAFDLRDFDLLLEDARSIYEKVTLRRNREILTATLNGEFAGFVVVEWGSEDQNVFSLFDCFRIFPVVEKKADREAVVKSLIGAALQVYAQNGVRSAICWSKDTSYASLVPGGKVFHDAYFWVADARRTKAFLRHLDRIHGKMDALRSSRRKGRESRTDRST